MWLTSSSIGRKFVMALTGICLVLFVTFHCLMNTVAICWPAAYNQICMFLGANWYALIASIGLAVLFILHIIYASWLTIQNRAARGSDRYAVTSRPPQVEWSSKNMYVLGVVVLAFLVVHLIQFWAKMQWMDIIHDHAYVDGVVAPAEFGTLFLQAAFSLVWTPIVYIIGFIALWFHMTHGFWSMFHTIGWDNNTWIERLKCAGNWWTTIVVALFVAQAIIFTVKAHNRDFINEPKLQEQYAEYWEPKAATLNAEFDAELQSIQQLAYTGQYDQAQLNGMVHDLCVNYASRYSDLCKALNLQCSTVKTDAIAQAKYINDQINGMLASAPQEVEESEVVVEEAEEVVEENSNPSLN